VNRWKEEDYGRAGWAGRPVSRRRLLRGGASAVAGSAVTAVAVCAPGAFAVPGPPVTASTAVDLGLLGAAGDGPADDSPALTGRAQDHRFTACEWAGEREHGRGLSGADTNSETLRSRPARDAAVAPDGGPVPSVRFVDCLGPAPRPPHPRPEPGRRRTAPAAATGHPSAPPRVTRGRDLSAPVDRWRAHRPASSLLSAVPPAGNGPPAGTTRRGGHRPGHGMSRTRPRTHPPSSPGSAASPRSARPSSSPVPQPAVSVPSGSTRPRHDRKGRTGCHARRIRR
jgi:hypothetical protein